MVNVYLRRIHRLRITRVTCKEYKYLQTLRNVSNKSSYLSQVIIQESKYVVGFVLRILRCSKLLHDIWNISFCLEYLRRFSKTIHLYSREYTYKEENIQLKRYIEIFCETKSQYCTANCKGNYNVRAIIDAYCTAN